MSARSALLFARTVRHLRPVQVYGRALKALRKSRPDLSPAPAVRGDLGPLAAPAQRPPVMLAPDRVELVGIEGDVSDASVWSDSSRPALWLYHLHYFDDLRSVGARQRCAWNQGLVERWIRENPPAEGVGWDPYPTSLRIVNWVSWERRASAGEELGSNAHESLAVQARHLAQNLEHHLLGNHLLANAKALVFAGVHFQGEEAERWLSRGLALLRRELAEQVLPDGGHFERSPMYHALVLEDVLDLVALARSAPNALGAYEFGWRDLAQRMLAWLRAMVHPDGEIALFNDAAIGQAPTPAALEEYARRIDCSTDSTPGPGVTWLQDSGYVRLERGPMVAICDVGEIGPSYLPGHAHADTLSFEASIDGRRLAVDSGTSHYEPGRERLRQRSTAAHNTVELDGESSSEVWSSFRVARRARVMDVAVEERDDALVLKASHDGYRRLPGRNVHTREWRLGDAAFSVSDQVQGPWKSAVARVHLHPDWDCSCSTEGAFSIVRATDEAGRRLGLMTEGAHASVENSTWHPRFGASEPNHVLRMELESAASARCALQLSW